MSTFIALYDLSLTIDSDLDVLRKQPVIYFFDFLIYLFTNLNLIIVILAFLQLFPGVMQSVNLPILFVF